MKKTLCLAAIIAGQLSIMHGQIKDFDLSKYKVPVLKRHTLDLDLNYYNSNQKQGESTNSQSHGNTGINYTFYYNSIKIQSFSRINPSFNLSTYNNDYKYGNNSSNNKNRLLLGSLNMSTSNKYYFYDKYFVGLDIESSITGSNSSYDYDHSNQINDNKNFKIKSPIKVGIGRIEDVSDARLALYILNDLIDNNVITKNVSDEEIIRFSEKIAEISNERIFDSRTKRIKEIEKIDSVLHDMGIIDTYNVNYYTSLHDNWVYSRAVSRTAGYNLDFGITPNKTYFKSNTEQKTDTTEKIGFDSKEEVNSLSVFLEANYNKPINLFWQFNAGASTGYKFEEYKYFYSIQDPFSISSIYVTANTQLSFIPNSRTIATLGTSLNYEHRLSISEKSINTNGVNNYSFNPYVSIDYYISPRMRMNLTENLNYRNHESVSPLFVGSENKPYRYNYINFSIIYNLM